MRDPLLESRFANDPQVSVGLAKTLEFVRRFIRRRWKLIALTTVPGVALAIAGLAIVPLRYNAVATILLENQRVKFFPNQSVVSEVPLEKRGN